MRIKEIIFENVHDPAIDWAKFKLAMAALAADTDRPGYGKIDGIVFLGLAGDPNSQSVLDVKLKSPARIGVADPDSGRELGFEPVPGNPGSRKSYTAGEYYSSAYRHDSDPSNKGYEIRKDYQYNIIINQRHFNQATGEFATDTLAHEAQHRGFDIITQIPEIINNVHPRTRKYVEYLNYRLEDIGFTEIKDTKNRETLAHLLMYSFEAPGQIGDGSSDTHMFRSKEEVKMFQMMYQDINKAAIAYVKRHPVPAGGLALLRNEVDRLTPSNVDIKITQGPKGTPIIKGIVDKIKSAVTPTPPPVVKQSPKVSSDPTADPEEPENSTPSVRNTDYKGSAGSQKLQQLNPSIKNVNLIYPGQKIKLPNNNTVTVKPGDTLDKIAAQNNIKEDQLSRIKQLSGLRS